MKLLKIIIIIAFIILESCVTRDVNIMHNEKPKIALIMQKENDDIFQSIADAVYLQNKNNIFDIDIIKMENISKRYYAILGPIYSKDLEYLKKIARTRNIKSTILSLSNDPNLAERNVYAAGFPIEEQIEKLFSYAEEKHINSIGMLIPNNAYGKKIHDISATQSREKKIKIAEEVYFSQGIKANLENKIKSILSQDIDALFIPQGGEILKEIIEIIEDKYRYKLFNVQLIGSGQWDDPEIYKMPFLKGGIFISSSSDKIPEFYERFKREYGYIPHRMATIAYDLANIVSDSIEKKEDTVTYISKGFDGINGRITCASNGRCTHDMAIIKISDGTVLDVSN